MLKDVEQHREVKGDQYNLAIDYLYGQEYYQKACKDVKDNPDLGSHCKYLTEQLGEAFLEYEVDVIHDEL